MHLSLMGIISGVGAGITYLQKATGIGDDATFVDAQELNTASEGVEIGNLTVFDPSTGTVKIVSNEFELTGTGAVSSSGLAATSGITKTLGRTTFCSFTAIAGTRWSLGFSNTSALGLTRFIKVQALSLRVSATGGSAFNSLATLIDSTPYKIAAMLGGYDSSGVPYTDGDTKANFTYGMSYYIQGGVYTNWTLLWRESTDNTSTLYQRIENRNAVAQKLTNFHVDNDDLSLLNDPTNLSISVSTNDTFTHAPDCFIEVDVTTLPSSGNLDIEFRRQDDSNKWICRVTSAGAIELLEVVATVETSRIGPVASAVSNGTTVKITADDESIYIFGTELVRGNYESAVNFKSDTGGKIVFGSGAVAFIADHPRNTAYSSLGDY